MRTLPRRTDMAFRKGRRAVFALGFAVSAAVALGLVSSTASTQEADPVGAGVAKARKDKPAKPPRKVVQSAAEPQKSEAPAPAGPAPIVCLLNRQEVNQVSIITTSSSRRLDSFRQDAQGELDKTRLQIEADYKALVERKPSPSDDALKTGKAALDERMKSLAVAADLKKRQIDATRDAVNAQIMSATSAILRAVAKEKACTLTLSKDAVVDGDGIPDITSAVIAEMNARLNPLPFALVAMVPATPTGQ